MFQKFIWASCFSVDAYIADLKQVTETASKQISGAMKVRSLCVPRGYVFYFLDLLICH